MVATHVAKPPSRATGEIAESGASQESFAAPARDVEGSCVSNPALSSGARRESGREKTQREADSGMESDGVIRTGRGQSRIIHIVSCVR